ncbi:MAG: hypothetical protein U5L01_07750 [Rheinheimera sp.]|nr:hypothetical protein [Rheinheimera sp.]
MVEAFKSGLNHAYHFDMTYVLSGNKKLNTGACRVSETSLRLKNMNRHQTVKALRLRSGELLKVIYSSTVLASR